jgi:hypothetical protein
LTSISSTPDVEQETNCNIDCCACNEANGEQRLNAQRIRHFCIEGDISVTEDISYHQLNNAVEASEGRAHKHSECVLNNDGNEELPAICIEGVSACPPDANGDGGLGSGTGVTH